MLGIRTFQHSNWVKCHLFQWLKPYLAARPNLYSTQSDTEFISSSFVIEHSHDVKEIISEYGLKANHLFEVQPDLQKYSLTEWKKKLKLFKENGLSQLQTLRILSTTPLVMDIPTEDLSQRFNNLRRLGLGERKLFNVLYKYPFYLLISNEAFKERVDVLFEFFPRIDIQRLFVKLPETFIDPWNVVEEKIRYIVFDFRVEQCEVYRAHVLRYDMRHIRLRHQFSLRSGTYRTPKPNPERHKVKNPKIKDIIHASKEKFLEMCKLTSEEYEVFQKMLAKEKAEDDELSDECETPAKFNDPKHIVMGFPKSSNTDPPVTMSA